MRPGSSVGSPAAGVLPSAVTYSAVLSYAGTAGEVDTALLVLQGLRDDGWMVAHVTYLDAQLVYGVACARECALSTARALVRAHVPQCLVSGGIGRSILSITK